MDSLRKNLNTLIEKTLRMEYLSPTDPRLQSQPMYESNVENLEEESQEVSQQVPEKSQDSSNKIVNRRKIRYTATRIKYSATRIKSRNFLSNISYTGINKNDFYNENFILDVHVLLVKNLNPFSLSRKVTDKTKHEIVYMLWRECIPSEFYRYICQEKNFIYLNGRDVGQPAVLEIVGNFIDQSKENLRMLQEHLAPYKDVYQYVYSHVFPEVYTTSEKRGFNMKNNFHILFKAYRDKMLMREQLTAKNPANYDIQKETCNFDQKPTKNFDQFSDRKEQEVKERAEKRLAEQRKKAEDLKAKKRKLKLEEDKVKEREMWNRLNELNGEIKNIK